MNIYMSDCKGIYACALCYASCLRRLLCKCYRADVVKCDVVRAGQEDIFIGQKYDKVAGWKLGND